MPLSIEGAATGKIQVTVVSGEPSTQFWTSIPDESALLGKATTATVNTQSTSTPCGEYQVVTVSFAGKPVKISPGSVYWIVLQNPPGGTKTFYWNLAVGLDTSTTDAIYVVDSNGSRWLSYPPGGYFPDAMRVLGISEK